MSFLLKNWKAILGLTAVFVVSLYLIFTVERAKEILVLEKQVKEQQEYIEDRKGIENATESVRGIDSDAALEWLRNRSPSAAE